MNEVPISQPMEPTPSGQLSDEMRALQVASQSKQHFRQRPPVPLFSEDLPPGSQILSGHSSEAPLSQLSYMDLLSQDFLTPSGQDDTQDRTANAAFTHLRNTRTPANIRPNRCKRPRQTISLLGSMPSQSSPPPSLPQPPPAFGGLSLSSSAKRGPGDKERSAWVQEDRGNECENDERAGEGLSLVAGRERGREARIGPGSRIRRVRSPPCCRSMFVETTAEEEDYAAWRTQGPKARDVASMSLFRRMFKEITFIGEGSFSKAFRVRHRIDGREYVVKRSRYKVSRDSNEFAQFVQECQSLARLPPHRNVISYFGSWTEPDPAGGEELYLQLERCGLDLVKLRCLLGGTALKEGIVLDIARQVASALVHLHAHDIAHLDLKPENVFLAGEIEDAASCKRNESDTGIDFADECTSIIDADSGTLRPHVRLVLGDFGSAVRLEAQSGKTEASVREGDARYVPLELLNSDFSNLDKADVFSLGIMMYELASGCELPRDGQAYQDLRRGKVPLLPTATSSFMRLIRLLLHENPSKRPSADEILCMAPLEQKRTSPLQGKSLNGAENDVAKNIFACKENVLC